MHRGLGESRVTRWQGAESQGPTRIKGRYWSSGSKRWERRHRSTFHLTLMMNSAQVVETSVTITDNSPSQYYTHPDDQTTLLHVTIGFKLFTDVNFVSATINNNNILMTTNYQKYVNNRLNLCVDDADLWDTFSYLMKEKWAVRWWRWHYRG